jgi:hypothetical protein
MHMPREDANLPPSTGEPDTAFRDRSGGLKEKAGVSPHVNGSTLAN